MSTVKVNAAQIGQSITTTNNFTLYQPATPDGTVRLGNGNAGSVTDLVTLTSAGNLGIGTSSPASKLNVSGGNVTVSPGYGLAYSGDQTRFMTPEDNVSGAQIRYASGAICKFVNGSTEYLRINGGAPVLCLAGGNTSANGTGIAFPATQSASSDANTLDDYEEGTFTPSASSATGSITSYNSTGSYVKIGKNVVANFRVQLTNIGTGGGPLLIGNLPFAAKDTTTVTGATREDTTSGFGVVASAYNTTAIYCTRVDNSTPITANNNSYSFCISYITA